jgi:hypothetical protein
MGDQGFREAFDAAMEDISVPVEESTEATSEEALEEQAAPEVATEEEDSEPQAVDEGEPETEEQEDQAAFSWDSVPLEAWRDIERLPRDQTPVGYLRVKQDRDRFASELDKLQRKLEQLESQGKDETAEAQAPGAPEPPPDDADDKAWAQYQAEREAYLIEQARLKTREEIRQESEAREAKRQEEEALRQYKEWGENQYARLKKSEGFDEDVEAVMGALAQDQSRPWYAAMLASESGVDRLFEEARSIVQQQRERVQRTTRKATAKGRVTPRATSDPKAASADIDVPDTPTDPAARTRAIMDAFTG